MKQKKKKKNRLLSNIILAVSLGVFVVAGFVIWARVVLVGSIRR